MSDNPERICFKGLSKDKMINADLNACLTDENNNTEETDSIIKCTYCATEHRILSFNELKRGDHICLAGEKLKFNLSNKQYALYKHHALIKSVCPIDMDGSGLSAMITMIHFIWTPFSKTIKIRETREIKNLYNDEIYKYIYRYPTHSPEMILSKAEKLLAESEEINYSPLSYNCEHMVRWCVVGTTQCLQVDDLVRNIIQWAHEVGGFIGKLARAIAKCHQILREILRATNVVLDDVAHLAGNAAVITLCCMTLMYLLCCIYRTFKYYKEFQKKHICKKCFLKKKWQIWFTFCAFVISNLGGFGLLQMATTTWLASLFFSGSVIMSAASMYLAQNVYSWFKSPFSGLEIQIDKLTELKRGDVITFYHWGLKHDGVVSNVEINSCDNKGKLRIVHYSWPSLISWRIIVEEEIEINLAKDKVLRHDYSGYTVYDPDEVIRRAKMRIGETKFAVFSNRSSHFCFWAKVNETPNDQDLNNKHNLSIHLQYERPFSRNQGDLKLLQVYIDHRRGKLISTSINEKRQVRIRTEIKPGDVIEFKFHYGLLHKAICTAIWSSTSPSKVQLTIVHYGSSYTVVEETIPFDLKRDELNVYSYHPLHRFEKKDVIRRARAKVNEQNYCIIGRCASHFADSIISRGKDFVITSLEEIQLGDVIIYSYWGLWHEAVVIKKAEGHFEIVHYGLQSILATREIIKEELKIDLTKQVIQKKGFNGYYTYPNEVTIDRAMSRIGEQRFSFFGNRSFEFVHWCKVVQTPSVYSLKYIGNGNDDSTTIRKVVIIPHTGEVHTEFFHKNWIQHWEDLTIGTILHLKGTYGILVSLDQKTNTIGLCFSSSVGRVRFRRFHIDLKKSKECIWMYWCNPCKCHSPEETIDRALNRKMYRIPDDATAWEFCKLCVIKDEDEIQTGKYRLLF